MNNQLNLSVEESRAIEQVFFKLKPICNEIAISPSIKNAAELMSFLENVPPDKMKLFEHYILVPIFMHLANKSTLKSSVICSLLECLNCVLRRIRIQDINLFLKAYVLTFSQILSENDASKLSSAAEELKLIVMQCASTLIKNSEHEVLSEFYGKQHYGKLSMGVFACTRIALNEKSIRLREEALKTMIYLIQVQNETFESAKFKQQLGDVVMLMIPGVVSYSLAVATATDIQHHRIVMLAIRLWSRAISLVMEDNSITDHQKQTVTFSLTRKQLPNIQNDNKDWSQNKARTKEMIEGMTRTSDWLENSNRQLAASTQAFSALQSHQHWKVRLELVDACDCILRHASKNMSLSVPYLIEILIILSQDEHSEVSSASSAAIKLFSEKCENYLEAKSLIDIVEESMYELITKLPRIFRGIDITLKERQLALVSGYLDILGSTHVPILLSSAQHVRRLLNSLYIAATLDCTSVCLLEDISLRGLNDEYVLSENNWKKYKWCDTQKSQFLIIQICKKLIQYSDLSSIIHFLLDDFSAELLYAKEIIQLFHYVFSSGFAKDPSEVDLAVNVFNCLMDQNLWGCPINLDSDSGVTKDEAQNNVVQVCLLMDSVSSLATFIGRDSFEPLLLRCLYQLLECAGSPLYIVANTGLKSVNKMAGLYGGDVTSLVSSNVDYLSHHVTVNLRHAHRNPKVLAVLSVILKHSTNSVLPSLLEIIDDILIQSCDTFQERNAGAFLQVFYTFIMSVSSWSVEDDKVSDKTTDLEEKSIAEELLEYQKLLFEANQMEDDSRPESITEDEISEGVEFKEEGEPVVPNHIKLVVQILNRSLHFLPSKEQSKQIIVLQILESGVLLIRKWTDELLPIVHKIWSPLVQRFHLCDNHLLMQRAFALLKTLGHVSKDFIRMRTLKDVLPSICKTLEQCRKESIKRDTDEYKMTQRYKLQLSLLKGIGELALDMDLTEKELDPILKAITPYLSSSQPQTLQDACMDTIKLIGKEFSDFIWLHLMCMCPKQLIFTAPDERFASYQFPNISKEMKEYKKNVHLLLQRI